MSKYRWYIEMDSFTNEAVARLTASGLEIETSYHEGMICWDKNNKMHRKNLRECEFGLITTLLKDHNAVYKIKVFRQKLPGGKRREFDPKLFSKKRKLARKTKQQLVAKLAPRS